MPSTTLERREAVATSLVHGRQDPVWFIEQMLRAPLWDTQQAIVRALFRRPRARVAVKACHASGKTFVAARAVLAFFYLFPQCRILTTAPTWVGVRKLLWAEVAAAFQQLPPDMGGELLETELRAGRDWFAMGLSTDQGIKFQGHHADRMLVVLDEAPGVRPDIYEAIEGIRAGGDVRVLALGNPTLASGSFYDAFSQDRSGWEPFTIDAFDTPNLEGLTLDDLLALDEDALDDARYPYLVTRRWVREKYDEWGEQSPLWQARVRGAFPSQSEDALLSLAWLEAAGLREITPQAGHDWEAGIDVAGPGEAETSLAVRQGPTLRAQLAWTDPDPRGEVLATLSLFPQVQRVKVDSVGQGYYFARHLEEHGWRGKVVDVNVGVTSAEPEKYVNLKAEAYWGLRLRASSGDFAGLTDSLALAQLASIRYKHNARGQIVIESKDEALKRGVKSPDRAEGIMLAYYTPPESGFASW